MTTKMTIQRFLIVTAFILSAAVFSGAGSAFAQSATVAFCDRATLNGFVTTGGSVAEAWFEWGATQALGNATSRQTLYADSSVNSPVAGLSANTTYYFRMVSSNTAGISYGTILSFTTPSCTTNQNQPPVVTTNSASGVSAGSATLNGLVDGKGQNSTAWFEWGLASSFFINNTPQNSYGTGSSNYNSAVTGLQPNTTYYFRAAAQNASGTVYGTTQSFTTLSSGTGQNQSLTVSTNSATNVFSGSAILNGVVNVSGQNATAWFEWGLTTSFGNITPQNSYGIGGSNYSHLITGLQQNTTYYFRAVAQGPSGTIYGSTQSFMTGFYAGGSGYPSGYYGGSGYGYAGGYGYGACSGGYFSNGVCIPYNTQPSVTTYSATSVAGNFANLNGYVNTNGMVVMRWFEWGTSGSFLSNYTSKTTEGTASGPFSQTVAGLQPNTTYYFRAAAQGSGDTAYGNVLAFTTSGGIQSSTVSIAPATAAPVRVAAPAKPVAPTVRVSQAKSAFAFLSISESDTCILYNENRAYIVSYKNIGSRTLKNVVIRFVLPQDLAFVDTTNGTYLGKDRMVILLLGDLEAGDGGSFTVRTELARGADSGKDIVVTAYLMDTNSSTGAQEELVAYSVNKICRDNSLFPASAFFGGNGFLPDTLLEWLLLILTIFGLVALSRYFYARKKEKREEASRL